ncbi:hypothetical protein CMQ_3074 [Grosmannia clavigera kw1407]|uniref:Uncharacterized protein n=1 Tax=Grosmannia clavigera (strain kw1407 / UAMH 11150) TaxID=655863 RepID=F0XG97_GROCL|nr:uncharacterized protein CMQ_3074 [Grosmannia clavigera kw1407]EFX03145.1 hypothetical protein CMQ_3074 [Grosmannia clavigera kw1407]
MDPVTAIGLASSIIAFVDFGWKLIKGAKEIYDAADGTLEENRSREAVVLEMKRLTVQLVSPEHSLLSGEERDLCLLAGTCHLEKRLGACRSQLALHINATTMFSIDKLSEYVKDNASSLKPLKKAMSQLSRIGADTQTQVRQLLNIQKNALHAIIKARILAGLKFEGMHDRHDMVAEAHEKTFRWIFNVEGDGNQDMQGYSAKTPYRQDDATKEEAELKEEARERFLQWLSSGSGIFHISGKMGSGKSTLVNFLSDHPETATRLETWATSFFFWRPGSDMQKSLSGLYRSLLHDVLSFCPELILDVFPSVWQRAMETPYDGQTKEYFQESDIKNGFNVLVTKEELFEHHSFCFFIDGLDEYQTPVDAVISDMVGELCRWTITSPSSVKLCVSSREYPEFMDKFSPSQRLRLHTLTRFDIEVYVRDKLGRTEDKGIATLTKSIVEKASGIFFWVSLVVRQIREQLEIGVEPARLVEIVNGYPVGLDHLYRHILQTLSPYSRKRAYQTLTMMPFVGGTSDSLPLDLLAYSFLDKYNEDPEFARKETFDAGLPQLRACEETTRSQARSLLNGWCRGLVEADENGHLGYAHRSVADFLEAADIRERMAASVNGSHPVSIFSELILAHLKVDKYAF